MKCPLAPKAEQLFFPGNCTSEICTVFRVEFKKKKKKSLCLNKKENQKNPQICYSPPTSLKKKKTGVKRNHRDEVGE